MKPISVVSWNVNGIRAVYRKSSLCWLTEMAPDILCLQETRASILQLSEELAHPEGYYAYWNGAFRPGYGGTALLSRKKPLSVQYGLGYTELDGEGRTIIAEYTDFVLINCYFPNGNRNHSRLMFKLAFYEAFLAKCEQLRKQDHTVIFCGDLNTAHMEIDLANPQSNTKKSGFLPEERVWIDRLIECGYIDTFRYFYPNLSGRYTWWSNTANSRQRNIGWRFDYFFIASEAKNRITDAFTMPHVYHSDHCPVGIRLLVSDGL